MGRNVSEACSAYARRAFWAVEAWFISSRLTSLLSSRNNHCHLLPMFND
jgi:hypothetical protein